MKKPANSLKIAHSWYSEERPPFQFFRFHHFGVPQSSHSAISDPTPPQFQGYSAKRRFLATVLLIAFSLAPICLHAESDMMKLRKKVQNSKVQRTQTYIKGVSDALAQNDIPAAEKALSAAIAQGTLTQSQINEAKAAIQSRSSSLSAARLAQENALLEKRVRELEQALAQRKDGPDETK